MENNTANKLKFFAQYIYQEVLQNPFYDTIDLLFFQDENLKVSKKSFPFTQTAFIEDCHLLLKPLSDISDEDINCVVEIFLNRKIDNVKIDRIENFIVVIYNKEKSLNENYTEIEMCLHIHTDACDITNNWNYHHEKGIAASSQHFRNILDVYDFLRSKGYLLPFMGLSTEEIINRGWAVTTNLKTE